MRLRQKVKVSTTEMNDTHGVRILVFFVGLLAEGSSKNSGTAEKSSAERRPKTTMS
jgi:hypothetical protein